MSSITVKFNRWKSITKSTGSFQEFNKYQDGLNDILDLTSIQTFNTKPKRNELFKNSSHITMHCGNY